jgi:uncharacterized membrane protein
MPIIQTRNNRRARTAHLISLLLSVSLVVGESECLVESEYLFLKEYIKTHPNPSQIRVLFLLLYLLIYLLIAC